MGNNQTSEITTLFEEICHRNPELSEYSKQVKEYYEQYQKMEDVNESLREEIANFKLKHAKLKILTDGRIITVDTELKETINNQNLIKSISLNKTIQEKREFEAKYEKLKKEVIYLQLQRNRKQDDIVVLNEKYNKILNELEEIKLHNKNIEIEKNKLKELYLTQIQKLIGLNWNSFKTVFKLKKLNKQLQKNKNESLLNKTNIDYTDILNDYTKNKKTRKKSQVYKSLERYRMAQEDLQVQRRFWEKQIQCKDIKLKRYVKSLSFILVLHTKMNFIRYLQKNKTQCMVKEEFVPTVFESNLCFQFSSKPVCPFPPIQ